MQRGFGLDVLDDLGGAIYGGHGRGFVGGEGVGTGELDLGFSMLNDYVVKKGSGRCNRTRKR